MVELIGVRRVDYTNKQGRPVQGYSLYLASESQRKDLVGREVFDAFVSDEVMAPVLAQVKTLSDLVGEALNLVYNRYGRLESVGLASEG